MILDAARLALSQLFTAPFRAVFVKTLGLTLLGIAAMWFGLKELLDWLALDRLEAMAAAYSGWLGMILGLVAGFGLAIGLALLVAPVTAMFAGLFLDEIAETVERTSYPHDRLGQPVPAFAAFLMALKFFGVVVLGNVVALLLLLVPGVNIGAFFLVNGYLLGREFFEFAAMRFRPEPEAKALRRQHAVTVFLAGLVIAAFLAVPLLNLLTPLFGAAMMVHLHKAISAREAVAPGSVRRTLV